MAARRTTRTLAIAPPELLDERAVPSTVGPHLGPLPHATPVQQPPIVGAHWTANLHRPTLTRPSSTHPASTPRGSTPPAPVAPPVASTPAASTPAYTPNGTAMDRAGQTLNIVYRDYLNYLNGGAQGEFASSQAGIVKINGTSVGVDVRADTPANVGLVTARLQALGMQVTATSPTTGVIEGSLPIAQLPTVAGDADVASLAPVERAVPLGGRFS